MSSILNEDRVITGSMISELYFPNISVMYGNAGLDFTIIDCEHGCFDYSQVAAIVTAMRLSGVVPIVRIPEIRREPIIKYLDMGAEGLLAPMVRNADDAKRLVDFGKYPPAGNRGLSINRAHSRYNPGDMGQYLKSANDKINLYVQIELSSALEDVGNIAAVEGIAGLFVGPTDLSMAIGVFNKPGAPELDEACRRVAESAKSHGKASGIITGDMRLIKKCRSYGMNIFCAGSETRLLSKGLSDTKSKLCDID